METNNRTVAHENSKRIFTNYVLQNTNHTDRDKIESLFNDFWNDKKPQSMTGFIKFIAKRGC